MEPFLKLLFSLALCQWRIIYCQKVTSVSAWRIDLVFNISCNKYANFNVYSSLLFDKYGPVAKTMHMNNNANRYFRQSAKLDRIPNLEFDKIDLKIEIELENNEAASDQIYPENALSLNVSYLHMGEMTFKMEKKWPDEDLKFARLGRSKIINIVDIDFERQFKRSKYSDCYHDQEYYFHDEIMTPLSCRKDILFCKCSDGITSQYCEILPKNCSLNSDEQIEHLGMLTIAEKRRICHWSMGICCPMIKCPERPPLIYCRIMKINHNYGALFLLLLTVILY